MSGEVIKFFLSSYKFREKKEKYLTVGSFCNMADNDTPIVLGKWHFLSRSIRRCRGKNEFRVP